MIRSNRNILLKVPGTISSFNWDEFHYLASRIQRDFLVTADMDFPNPSKRKVIVKVGWMVRENLQEDAAQFGATKTW